MVGAREYAELLESGQYGKLYLSSGSHARGKTFHIQVLPEGEIAEVTTPNTLCTNDTAVLVYGVVSGNPGWTETYGWLHRGKWQDDFSKLVEAKRKEVQYKNDQKAIMLEQRELAHYAKERKLLSEY